MIASVDTHIVNRLKRMKLGATIINVYGPGAARDIGETQMPCIAVSHNLPPRIDYDLAMPHLEVFKASTTQQNVAVPEDGTIYLNWIEDENNGSSIITGPASWTRRAYPTPVTLYYQLDLLASNLTHMTAMRQLMFEAFPPGYEPKIGDYYVRFMESGDQTILDDLENPLFRTVYRYEVCNVWIDRLTSYTTPSINEAALEFETVEEL